MILEVLEKYSRLIKEHRLHKFRFIGTSHEIVLTLHLKNKSTLFVRDYLFSGQKRKYSYHWQDKRGKCLFRWDNAFHHQGTKTFPYHVHVGKKETVRDGTAMTLEKVLKFIKNVEDHTDAHELQEAIKLAAGFHSWEDIKKRIKSK